MYKCWYANFYSCNCPRIYMTLSTNTLVGSISESLECKMSYEPLDKAVSLWPCLHTMDENSAVQMYGTIVDEKCSKVGIACFLCRKTVVSYGKNHLICELSTEVQRLKTMINEECNQKEQSISDSIVMNMDMLETRISKTQNSQAANSAIESAYRRKRSKSREEKLEDYEIVHPNDYERGDHSLSCQILNYVGGCFGWTVDVGIE